MKDIHKLHNIASYVYIYMYICVIVITIILDMCKYVDYTVYTHAHSH